MKRAIFALLTCATLIAGCGGRGDGYSTITSNMWTGVKVYYRDKAPAFTIIGGNNSHKFPDGRTARGIQVLMPDGRITWKNRDDLVKADSSYLVKNDDPALSNQQWKVIQE